MVDMTKSGKGEICEVCYFIVEFRKYRITRKIVKRLYSEDMISEVQGRK